MTSGNDNLTASSGGEPDEERLGELINEFFDRRERGEDISQEAFLAEHAEHAEALREHLVGLDLLAGMGASSKDATQPHDAAAQPKGSSAKAWSTQSGPPLPDIPGYEIHKLLGRGGMGLVYKATHLSTKRSVALKVLLEGPLASDQARRRFEREIAVAAQLRHANIIPIYDSGACDGRMYYAMEYVRGLSLGDYIKAHKLDIPSRLRLFQKLCQAVLHAHQHGVVHRDLKPSNILIDGEGEPHILDFGLAKAAAYADNTTSITAQLIGTPAYMSPEQTSGDPGAIDMRTDIYSLCVVLYEMLTGHMPYDTKASMGKLLEHIASTEPTPPAQYESKIDGELSAIVLKGLEKSKDQRYQSLDVLSSDIAHYLAGEPISVRPHSSVYLLRKALWKNRFVLGIVAAVLLIATTVGLLLRHYAVQLNQAGVTLQEKKQELEAQLVESQKLKHQAEDLQAQRDKAERYRATYESLLQNLRSMPDMNPEVVKGMETLTARLGESVRRGEDVPTAVTRLLAQGLSDIQFDKQKVPPKDTNLNLDEPQMSPKPPGPPTGEQKPPEDARIPTEVLELLRRAVLGAHPQTAQTQPTSQPAATQPAATSQPAIPKQKD